MCSTELIDMLGLLILIIIIFNILNSWIKKTDFLIQPLIVQGQVMLSDIACQHNILCAKCIFILLDDYKFD